LASTTRAAVSKPALVQQVEPARAQPTVRQNPITAQAQARQVEESRPVMRQPVEPSREQDKPVESHSTAISQPDTRSSGNQDKASLQISAAKVGSVTMEQVSKAWKEISHLVKSKDPQSAALINSGRIIEIRDGVLIISFQGEILQQKFDRPENLEITRKAIQKILGVDLLIQTVVSGNKNVLPAHVKPDGMVAAASELGGEIVDIQKT
jgi:hypothetical protein